jgi:hypothetical protein
MTGRRKIEGSRLIGLVRAYLDARGGAGEWNELLDSIQEKEIDVVSGDRAHWLRIYRQRRENALDEDASMAVELDRVINDLESYSGDFVEFALISFLGYGYMVWFSRELTFVITSLRAKDQRGIRR